MRPKLLANILLLLATTLLLGLSPTSSNPEEARRSTKNPTGPTRVFVVYTSEDGDQTSCFCQASLHSANGSKQFTTCCSTNPPFLHVRQLEAKKAKCKPDGNACKDDSTQCKIRVAVDLIFPVGTCQGTGGVSGPGIGTTGEPCQPAAPPQVVTCEWTMNPKCKPGASPEDEPGNKWMKFWCGGCSPGLTEPGTEPDLKFLPVGRCGACL